MEWLYTVRYWETVYCFRVWVTDKEWTEVKMGGTGTQWTECSV